MKLLQHPELLQKLAASYALGTLRGGARRRFETLAREHPSIRAAALLWQTHWAGLTELQAPTTPAPAVWTRIDNLLQGERSALRQRSRQALTLPWWQRLGLWQGAAGLGAFATLAAVVVAVQFTGNLRSASEQQVASLQAQLSAQAGPQTRYIAVLRDQKSSAALLVTYNNNSSVLELQRLGDYAVPTDRSLQLWALPATGKPRSLGVLAGQASEAIAASAESVQGIPTLAISLEPKGGVPSEGGPTGPVIFTGEWIQKTA